MAAVTERGQVKKRGRETRVSSGLSRTDAVWNSMTEVFRGMVDDTRPMMATVISRDRSDQKGGNIKVRVDDDDDNMVYSIARTRGVVYNPGDRVWVQLSRSGEMVITGAVASGITDADERAIANEQLYNEAVDGRTIKPLNVGRGHIADLAVNGDKIDKYQIKGGENGHIIGLTITERELAPTSVIRGKLANGAVGTDQIDEDVVKFNKLHPDARKIITDKADETWVTGKLGNYYSTSQVDTKISNVNNNFSNYLTRKQVNSQINNVYAWVEDNYVQKGRFCVHSCQNKDHELRIRKLESNAGLSVGSYKYCDSARC